MKHIFLLFCSLLFAIVVGAQLPSFDSQKLLPAPDYSLPENWAALPFRQDAADEIPKNETWINDSLKEADVFYVHPTMYANGETWNADLSDQKLNSRVDRLPVRFQASPFNKVGRVYAPRYRQAILDVFHHPSYDGQKALNLAYEDVKRAFEHYLKHYNNGRPVIIASHSQGSLHARKLLKDFFDEKPLKKQLVAAYVIGYAINESMYTGMTLCKDSLETGCYITWMACRWGYKPKGDFFKNNVSLNPLTWNTTPDKINRKQGVGGILLNPRKKFKYANTVKIYDTHLWVRTQIPFFPFLKNMHVIDYNLFWYDIRENVDDRFNAYKKSLK